MANIVSALFEFMEKRGKGAARWNGRSDFSFSSSPYFGGCRKT